MYFKFTFCDAFGNEAHRIELFGRLVIFAGMWEGEYFVGIPSSDDIDDMLRVMERDNKEGSFYACGRYNLQPFSETPHPLLTWDRQVIKAGEHCLPLNEFPLDFEQALITELQKLAA